MSISVESLEDFQIDYYKRPELASILMSQKGVLNKNIDAILAKVTELTKEIIPFYNSLHIKHSNICGPNTDYIIKTLTGRYDLAKIIIGDWPATDIETTAKLERRTALFGNRGLTMFVSYHAFPLFYFSDVNLYIAIETTLCDDTYKLQYIIGESPEQIELFIKKLYLANKFIITRDYTKHWYELIYPSKGGHKRNRKMYRKSRKILRKRRRYSRKN